MISGTWVVAFGVAGTRGAFAVSEALVGDVRLGVIEIVEAANKGFSSALIVIYTLEELILCRSFKRLGQIVRHQNQQREANSEGDRQLFLVLVSPKWLKRYLTLAPH